MRLANSSPQKESAAEKMKKADTSKIKSEAQAIADKIELPRIPQQEFHPVCEQFTDISPALNAAIRACAGSGGGRVIVPAGSYRCNGPIQMASCVELHFEDGAFLKFSPVKRTGVHISERRS